MNGDGEAERFYRSLGEPALVGVEACGNSQWLVELIQRLWHELWVGDAAQIQFLLGHSVAITGEQDSCLSQTITLTIGTGHRTFWPNREQSEVVPFGVKLTGNALIVDVASGSCHEVGFEEVYFDTATPRDQSRVTA